MKIRNYIATWHATAARIVLLTALCFVYGCGSEDYYYESYEDAPEADAPAARVRAQPEEAERSGTAHPLAYTNIDVVTGAGKFQLELGADIEIPAELIKLVPHYEHAQLVNCLTGPDAIFATYSTPISEEKVFAFYEKENLAMGWEYQKAFTVAGRRMLTAQRAGKRLTITFQEQGIDRLITVMLSDRRPEELDLKALESDR